ncbi:MAG: HDOD domain-containing protein [Nitrospiraceae bacterium]|nr:MAG: HDOD domain-containing protein [Nitrospiraceae bacterium]
MLENFKDKIQSLIEYLPPIPGVMNDLIKLLNAGNCDVREISDLIEKDPSLSVNILRIANSAFYGLPYKVSSLQQAVNLIGLKELASLCMFCSIGPALKPPAGMKTIDLKMFWRHSIATGIIAKIFCREFSIGVREDLYLAGLIHDIGKIIIDRSDHDVYSEVVRLTYDNNVSIGEAENKIIGESHSSIGSWLLEKWKLPRMFIETAAYHHSVRDASEEHRELVAVVSLADQIARLRGFGFGGDMRGTIINETEAFAIVRDGNPHVKDIDLAGFVMDLDRADSEISELEKIING